MSIEQSLERIATALEKLSGSFDAEFRGVKEGPVLTAEPKAKKAPKVVDAVPVEEDMLGTAAPVAEKKITLDEVHAALKKYMEVNKIDKTKALMIKYGADKAKPVLTSIPEKNYPALMAELGA